MYDFLKKFIVFSSVFYCTNLYAFFIQGYTHFPDKADQQFSNFTIGKPNSDYYLSFSSNSDIDVILTVEKDDSTSKIASFSVVSGTTLRFPQNEKFISLSESGIYNFVVSKNNNEELGRISILISKENQLTKKTIPITHKKTSNSKITNSSLIASYFKKESSSGKSSYFDPPKEIMATVSSRSAGSKIYKKYSESVVLIENDEGIGSGILIKEDLILTNKHVVGDNNIVRVAIKPKAFDKISSQRRYEGRVIKYDETKDLALVKLNWPIKAVPTLSLAENEKMEVASSVHAIGHPRGEYWTYTRGYISQIRPEYEWVSGDKKYLADIIQTQTPINPGNSGGPLINENGELIGVNSFIRPDSAGLNYAVAASSIRDFLDSNVKEVKAEKINDENDFTCEPVDIVEGNKIMPCDRDNNGINDIAFYDARGNGGFYDVYYDDNENRIFERMLRVVPLEDGTDFWLFFYDNSESGSWSILGYDYDKNWEIDEWDAI